MIPFLTVLLIALSCSISSYSPVVFVDVENRKLQMELHLTLENRGEGREEKKCRNKNDFGSNSKGWRTSLSFDSLLLPVLISV